jgi:glyoxylase-like metal-dependent hydrolase (beta-lactamase superfamily II)
MIYDKEAVMRQQRLVLICYLAIITLARICYADSTIRLSPHVSIYQDTVNGVFIEKDGHTLVIYGDPGKHLQKAETMLFTHSRRDVVWAGRELVENGAESIVPLREADNFSKVNDFWTSFAAGRFHDYQQQGTKILTMPLRVDRKVSDADTFNWRGIPIRVMDTPGYTRGSVSYFVNVDGLEYGFVGDTIFGDGQILDLYSLQDAVSEAKIGGYHGYAGRMGELIGSLRKVLDRNPDVLVPAHGPVIKNPKASLGLLIQRLQAAYENYLSISAGRWYFKDQYETLAARVLDSPAGLERMPYAAVIEKQPPTWVVCIQNSRLLLSEDRCGFLIDCGSKGIIDEVIKLRESGKLSQLDGVFITHYHDDHTDKVSELVQQFRCPVYATCESKDILENPWAYRLPCLTPNSIADVCAVSDGHKMRWKEFTLTFYYFPGQTLYHDALFVEKDGGGKILFAGDSFTPSGIDDYCLQNRNFLHQGMGYFYCLNFLRKMPPDHLLINQHVLEPFRFNIDQLEYMAKALGERKEILAHLFPWDESNYGLDEYWARIYPYGQKVRAGQSVEIAVKIFNHSSYPQTYTVSPNVPEGLRLEPKSNSIKIEPRKEAEARFKVTIPNQVSRSLYVVTSDIKFGEWNLRHWCESIIEVSP